ncbi:hypothetical protein [Clostridium sp. B9]|uniref:hypothetical protein n=1 Tax=Clostridium sp. B9 TaxID=3423224 RepID=UPI003D2EC32D
MLDKEKVQEALNKNFNNLDYLVIVSYPKKSKDVEIKKEYVLKEIEAYIGSVEKMLEIFSYEKQKLKYFYTIAEFDKIFVARIVIERYLDEDKMNGIFEWMKVRKIRELKNLAGYLLKDGIKDMKYSKGFFKGINI